MLTNIMLYNIKLFRSSGISANDTHSELERKVIRFEYLLAANICVCVKTITDIRRILDLDKTRM